MHTSQALDPMIATGRDERIVALDVARGTALLGIFLVNIHLMADALGAAIRAMSGVDAEGQALPAVDRATLTSVSILAAGKFYPLFSMLFGIGMALSYDRLVSSGRWFAGAYLRRLALLMAFGLAHAWVLWYGDVLVYYAVCGLGLMIASRWGARALLIVGVGLFAFGTVLVGGLTLLVELAGQMAGSPQPGASTGAFQGSGSLFLQALDGFATGQIEDIDSPAYIALEREASGAGPWYDALAFRLWNWFWAASMSVLGFGWQIVGLFLVGAGLLRAGVFAPERAGLRRRLMAWCLAVGLALAIGVEVGRFVTSGVLGSTLGLVGQSSVGAVLSLGYLMLLTEATAWRWLRPVTAGLAAAGRMALTNYLMQSLIASLVFSWWGFGLFGTFSPTRLVGFVLAVFVAQVLVSVGWLSIYRMGPLEWVWRSATYMSLQPMHREPASARG